MQGLREYIFSGVVLSSNSSKAFTQRFRTWFPDREFSVRSQDKVHTFKLSSKKQVLTLVTAFGLFGVWFGSLGAVALSSQTAQAELAEREADVARAEAHVKRYHQSIKNVATDLAQRQDFIEQVVEAHIGEPTVAAEEDDANASKATSNSKAQKMSQALPAADALAELEKAQFALVERLTNYAQTRTYTSTQAIRGLGLNPNTLLNEKQHGVGGPLEQFATARDGSLDPRFERMGQSLARMSMLVNGMDSIPQVNPTHVAAVSSSFGYRSDPFTGAGAFHAGLDFPGPMGSPIYAAAKGKVTFVGFKSGYGNCVEITHGNGLMTRYAHLQGFKTLLGQTVEGGAHIASMGSTGRSTGPHLHFEVRVHDRPVNPRHFLETAQKKLDAEQRQLAQFQSSKAQKGNHSYG